MLQVARGKWVKKENIILRLKENGSKYRLPSSSQTYMSLFSLHMITITIIIMKIYMGLKTLLKS